MKKLLIFCLSITVIAGVAVPAQTATARYAVYQKTLTAFSASATSLTSAQKAQVKAAVDANPTAEKFICTGIRYFDQPASLNITVRSRAKAACEYAKQLNPALSTWYQNKPTQAKSYAGKVLLTVKSLEAAPASESYVASPIETCQLKDQRILQRQQNNVGFPLEADTVPAKGIARAVVVPVSFSDAAPEPNLLPWAKTQMEKMVEWYEFTSQGKLKFEVQYPQTWVKIDVPASTYGVTKGIANVAPTNADRERNQKQQELIQEIAKKIDPSVDLSNVSLLILVFPRSATEITTSILQREVAIETPAGRSIVMAWGTGKDHFAYPDLEWALLAHETLHSQGLALHAPGNGSDFGLGQNQYAKSATLSGWEMFRLGWLEDSQVVCLDAINLKTQTSLVNLSALEINSDEPKIIVVRVSSSKALVVESRRPVGYSKNFKQLSGLVIYEVDVTLDNDRANEASGDTGNNRKYDKWGYLLAPHGQSNASVSTGQSEKFIFGVGDFLNHEGVAIKLSRSGSMDSVEISSTAD
ncbi:MAG: hypothetical protein K9G13_05515 [Aquiluna sp.]|nr:hypothetical protein [Aquiluna sp.]MCF8545976.1 hypothetical protein [Aquiluna sp.]